MTDLLRPAAAAPSTPFRLGHRPELDGLRGVAALAILVYHSRIANFLGGGQGTMELFFTLSGFLITGVLLEDLRVAGRVRFGRFYLRRAARLLPALGLMIAVVLVIAAVDERTPQRDHVVSSAAAALFYVINWWELVNGPHSGLFGGLWSLSIEEQFYAVWPILLTLVLRIRWRHALPVAIVAGVAGSIVMRVVAQNASLDRMRNGTDTRALGLLLGASVALLCHHGWPVIQRLRPALWVGGYVAAIYLMALPPLVRVYDQRTFLSFWLFAPLCTAVVIAHCLDPERDGILRRALRLRTLTYVGSLSYAIYLYHGIVLWFLETRWPALTPLWRIAIAVPVSVGIAAISRRLVEEPVLARAKRAQP